MEAITISNVAAIVALKKMTKGKHTKMDHIQIYTIKSNVKIAEDTFKMFMDVYLRESEVYRRLQEADKKERERAKG